MLYELLQKKDRIRNLKHVVTNCLSSKVATTLLTRTITCISPIITKCKKKKKNVELANQSTRNSRLTRKPSMGN